jgi:hypothetical protein
LVVVLHVLADVAQFVLEVAEELAKVLAVDLVQ